MTTPIYSKKYHLKNPKAKFWIAHDHKRGSLGKPVKGSTGMSYAEVSKMHSAIALSQG
jgi:hypothetical protein